MSLVSRLVSRIGSAQSPGRTMRLLPKDRGLGSAWGAREIAPAPMDETESDPGTALRCADDGGDMRAVDGEAPRRLSRAATDAPSEAREEPDDPAEALQAKRCPAHEDADRTVTRLADPAVSPEPGLAARSGLPPPDPAYTAPPPGLPDLPQPSNARALREDTPREEAFDDRKPEQPAHRFLHSAASGLAPNVQTGGIPAAAMPDHSGMAPAAPDAAPGGVIQAPAVTDPAPGFITPAPPVAANAPALTAAPRVQIDQIDVIIAAPAAAGPAAQGSALSGARAVMSARWLRR